MTKRAAFLVFGFVLFFQQLSLASEPITPIPVDYQFDREKALLGKQLFFDATLSLDNSVSCASCHDPFNGGVDHQPHSTGVGGRKGTMNSPSVLNATFNFRQFWNGRAKDLREQAAGPILNPAEMAMTVQEVEKRLNANEGYRKQFSLLYKKERIGFDDAIDALVEFEKALTTPDGKFDKFLRGEGELNENETEGYRLFKQLGCVSCHNGVNVGGNSFQYFGIMEPYDSHEPPGDRFSLTKDPFDKNRFKVPTLRNVAFTAPYLHDGRANSLEEAVRLMALHNLGIVLANNEIARIVAFLKTLTGKTPEILR